MILEMVLAVTPKDIGWLPGKWRRDGRLTAPIDGENGGKAFAEHYP